MCFSAQASFTVATALVTLGALSVNKAKTPLLKLFALTPLFFAVHQILEGIVWLTINNGQDSAQLLAAATHGYVLIAGSLWPIWIPGILYLAEKNRARKLSLLSCLIIGAVFSLGIAYGIMTYGVTAQIIEGHLTYITPAAALVNPLASTILYPYATVLPLFLATTWPVWPIGVAIVAGYAVAWAFFPFAFASIWCLTAALASFMIYQIVTHIAKTVLV